MSHCSADPRADAGESTTSFHAAGPLYGSVAIQPPHRVTNATVSGHEPRGGISDGSSAPRFTSSPSVSPGLVPLTHAPPSESIGFFSNAHDFTQLNSTNIAVQGDYTVYQIAYHGPPSESIFLNSGASKDIAYKRCPPPTHLFTGRRSILNEMELYFLKEVGTRHVCVLHGLGGVGKTQIGYRFVDISVKKQRFSDVFFVDASTVDTIDTELENIALAKRIGKSADDAMRWFESQRQEWLILFNNADDITLNLFRFFPRCSHGNILITTRNPELCIYAPDASFKVMDLEEDEAIDLLLATMGRNNSVTGAARDHVTAIVKELCCHPLAVVQAGAYIARTRNLSGYLELYKTNRTRLWQSQPAQRHDDYQLTIYTTWKISVDRLQPEAAMFLRICSFMHHDGISEEIFKNSSAAINLYNLSDAPNVLVDFLHNFLSPSGDWDPFLFQEIVADVQSYSLIDFDDANKVFSVHPLVHTWMRTMANDDISTQACTQHLVGLSVHWRYEIKDYVFRRALQPHVDAVMGYNQDLDPGLLHRFAFVYKQNGRFNEAEKLYVTAVNATKRVLGEEHPDTLTSINSLAGTYQDQGRFNEAEKLYVVVMDARKRVLGEEHPDTFSSLNNLAWTYLKQGRFNEAEKLYVTVVDVKKRVLGEEHLDTLGSINNLAGTYLTQGRFIEAEKLYVVVMDARKRMLGEEHPDTLTSLNCLAVTYHKQGRFNEAEKLYLTVMDARKRVLGEEHPDTLTSINNLAGTYPNQRRFNEAEKLYVAVVGARKRVLGEEHPDTLSGVNNLALTYLKQGRFNEAEKLYLPVVDARKRVLGEEHPDTLNSINNLVFAYLRQSRFNEAEKLCVAVADARKRVLGEEHPDTLTSINILAMTYLNQDRFNEAEKLYLAVVDARKRVLGEEHPDTLISTNQLALTYLNQGRINEAEKLLVTVVEGRKRVLGEQHTDTLNSISNLANLQHRGRGTLGAIRKFLLSKLLK